jgi:hypothetical protein
LADQIVALISPEQAKAMVWTHANQSTDATGSQTENFEESRMFSFEVAKSMEQEEDAIATTGFTVRLTGVLCSFLTATQGRT